MKKFIIILSVLNVLLFSIFIVLLFSRAPRGLSKAVYDICDDSYDIIYQNAEESGLFQCADTHDIFSVTYFQDKDFPVRAWYLGTTHSAMFDDIFLGEFYIYRKSLPPGIMTTMFMYRDLLLLVEADSEAEVIDKYADRIYQYIQRNNNLQENEKLRISIFYTDNLDNVKTTLDYVILAGTVELDPWLPYGYNDDLLVDDDMPALVEIGRNPSLYSAQTRRAIKKKRHISLVIDDKDSVTSEQLHALLSNSFVDPL